MFLVLTKKNLCRGICIILFFCFCFKFGSFVAMQKNITTSSTNAKVGKLAIVIDDMGYNGEGTKEMLELPIAWTAAIMPFSSCSADDGKRAADAKKEVIVHIPMESLTGKTSWVGDKGIFLNMTNEQIRARVEEVFKILPQAVGANNHMGSAIMEDKRTLSAVMTVLREHDFFFLDSVTTPNSVAEEVANTNSVPLLKRKVFLDSTDDIEIVKKQLRLAGKLALDDGYAIAIGHVGTEGGKITAQAIAELSDELEKQGVQFVFLSDMLN